MIVGFGDGERLTGRVKFHLYKRLMRGDMHSLHLLFGRGFGGNSLIYIVTTTAIGCGGGGGVDAGGGISSV